MAKEEQASNDTFSVMDLHAALPTRRPWYPAPPYDPSRLSTTTPQTLLGFHEGFSAPYPKNPNPFYNPALFPEYPDIPLAPRHFDPSPPGFIPPSTRYYDLDWNKQSLDPDSSVVEVRHFGKIGLHCHNLNMGTNLKFLGARKRSYTGRSSQKVTFVAEDPVLCCTHTFKTHVYWPGYQDTLTVTTTTVPPTPAKEDGCRCASDDFFEGDMPDWLPEDASNKPQYYEMKKSEVEQEKEWLHLYAQLALSSLDWKSCKFGSPIELVKVIVQSQPIVGSKKNMVKADNAIFYMSFKSSNGLGYNGIVRRTRLGRSGELSLRVKCSLM